MKNSKPRRCTRSHTVVNGRLRDVSSDSKSPSRHPLILRIRLAPEIGARKGTGCQVPTTSHRKAEQNVKDSVMVSAAFSALCPGQVPDSSSSSVGAGPDQTHSPKAHEPHEATGSLHCPVDSHSLLAVSTKGQTDFTNTSTFLAF